MTEYRLSLTKNGKTYEQKTYTALVDASTRARKLAKSWYKAMIKIETVTDGVVVDEWVEE